VGLYERAQEVLARTNRFSARPTRLIDRLDANVSGRAFYIYVVLERASELLGVTRVGSSDPPGFRLSKIFRMYHSHILSVRYWYTPLKPGRILVRERAMVGQRAQFGRS
jgi:hypothetical protein